MFEAFFSDPDLIYRINVINSIDFYSLGFEMVRGETKAENMLQWLRKGEVADVLVTNVQCPDMSGFELIDCRNACILCCVPEKGGRSVFCHTALRRIEFDLCLIRHIAE